MGRHFPLRRGRIFAKKGYVGSLILKLALAILVQARLVGKQASHFYLRLVEGTTICEHNSILTAHRYDAPCQLEAHDRRHKIGLYDVASAGIIMVT